MSRDSEWFPFIFRKLPWLAGRALLLFLAFAMLGERGVLRVMDVSRQKDQMEEEIARITEQNKRLANEIRCLRSDKKFIEDVARRDLGMVRENENIYFFPSQPGN